MATLSTLLREAQDARAVHTYLSAQLDAIDGTAPQMRSVRMWLTMKCSEAQVIAFAKDAAYRAAHAQRFGKERAS